MDWKTLLAYITGTVDQELLLRNEYLVTENRILRDQLKGRLQLNDGERKTLADIGQKLGKQALKEVAQIVKPDTILGWHRKLVAQKFDGSTQRKAPGRPTIDPELEALIVRMAREHRSWGYDRIVGALAHLGYTVSDQTVGNVLEAPWYRTGSRTEDDHHLEGVYPHAYRGVGGHRLLHRGGLDPGQVGDVLRLVFYPSGQPKGPYCRRDAPSQ